MSPELEKSLKERIAAGVGYEEIEAELLAAGYSKEVIALAYATAKQATAPDRSGVLSSGTDLFKAGFAFARTRLDLVVLLGVSSALLNLTIFFVEDAVELVPLGIMGVVGFISFVVYMLSFTAAGYITVRGEAQKVSLKDGLEWAAKHFFSLWWTLLLVMVVVWAGLILFIVPGIILSILLYFTQYAYMHDNERGLQALLRSRALVLGRKRRVFKRIFIIGVYTGLITILVSLLYVLLEFYEINQAVPAVIVEIIVQLVTALLMIASVAAANKLYLELAEDRPKTSTDPSVVTKYRLLAGFGALAIIAFIVGVIALVSLSDEFADELKAESTGEVVRSEIIFTEPIAEGYFTERGTYEGVCDAITQAVTSADGVECNDSETVWALAAQSGDEYWCTDVTGYGKLIPGPLGDRTLCLNLPTMPSGVEQETPATEATSTPAATESEETIPMM